jgi:O-acetyl-ADP-ribose deacetylase (regulator of RNase III)
MNIILGDMTQMPFECYINAANGIGPMGRGIAGALKRAGGDVVQASAQEACRNHKFMLDGRELMGYNAGMTYTSSPGRMAEHGVKAIVHAVTMYTPGSPTNVPVCRTALVNALTNAISKGYKTIAVPALGTGVGGLNKREVASMMVDVIKNFDKLAEINIVDIDPEFINACKLAVQE